MPMNVGKRKANQLAGDAAEALRKHVTVVDLHKGEEVGKSFTVGWNPPKRSSGDRYGLL